MPEHPPSESGARVLADDEVRDLATQTARESMCLYGTEETNLTCSVLPADYTASDVARLFTDEYVPTRPAVWLVAAPGNIHFPTGQHKGCRQYLETMADEIIIGIEAVADTTKPIDVHRATVLRTKARLPANQALLPQDDVTSYAMHGMGECYRNQRHHRFAYHTLMVINRMDIVGRILANDNQQERLYQMKLDIFRRIGGIPAGTGHDIFIPEDPLLKLNEADQQEMAWLCVYNEPEYNRKVQLLLKKRERKKRRRRNKDK